MAARALRGFAAAFLLVLCLAPFGLVYGPHHVRWRRAITIVAAVPRVRTALTEIHLYGALRSWSLLSPPPHIYLLGEDIYNHSSVGNIDLEALGAEYFPGLQYTDFDDPKLSVVLHQTLALAQTDIVVLASPTTVLTQAFVAALRACVRQFSPEEGFLLVTDGRVVHPTDPLVFHQPDWFPALLRHSGCHPGNASAAATPGARCGAVHTGAALVFPVAVFQNDVPPDFSLLHPTGLAYLLGHLNQRNVPVIHAGAPSDPYVLMQQDELLQPEVEDELGTYNSDIATEFWPGSAPAFQYDFRLENTSTLRPDRVTSYFQVPRFTVVSSLERHTEAALAVENDTLVGVGHVAEGRVEERENEMDDYIVPDNRFQKEGTQETYGESELADTVDLTKSYDEGTFTIFSAPKPMTDPHIAMIQTNAIRSWAALRPRPHILIFGPEEGLDRLAATVGARHIPKVKLLDEKSRGVHSSKPVTPAPAMGSLFYQAMNIATTKSLVFINGDILLPPVMGDLMMCVNNATDRFLLLSHRYRMWIREYINFSNPEWYMDSFGKCDKPDAPKSCSWVRDSSRAVDYFGFTRLTWSKVRLLEFAIGRPAYDNWLVSKAALAGTPVISATEVMRALHQNHNYKHITAAAASAESQITGKNYELFMNPLADYNRRIIAFKEKEGLLVVRGDQRFNTFKMRQARKDCKATKYVSHGCGYQVARVHPNPRLKKYLPKLTAPPFHCKKPHLCLTHVMLPTGT
eukprot:EG_transcript_4045